MIYLHKFRAIFSIKIQHESDKNMTESVGGIQIQVRVTGLAAINDVIANLTAAGANLRPVMRDAATACPEP